MIVSLPASFPNAAESRGLPMKAHALHIIHLTCLQSGSAERRGYSFRE